MTRWTDVRAVCECPHLSLKRQTVWRSRDNCERKERAIRSVVDKMEQHVAESSHCEMNETVEVAVYYEEEVDPTNYE